MNVDAAYRRARLLEPDWAGGIGPLQEEIRRLMAGREDHQVPIIQDLDKIMLHNLIDTIREVGGAEYAAVVDHAQGDISVDTALRVTVRQLRDRIAELEAQVIKLTPP